ncbi:choice-of-anchor tandem repeat GloVer-containing protein [Pigmentiphaga daeguensis]|jgi:hypothetical protein|uniref:Uncharacterized protein n=1 Tax=Pigmentiphaga daeguensis TaxID=414049 RepID=A0ABN1BU25_9BURK
MDDTPVYPFAHSRAGRAARAWRMLAMLAVPAFCAPPAMAAEETSVVTHITSFHDSGPEEYPDDGPPKGWPAARYPTGVPLLVQGENGNFLYTPTGRRPVLLSRVATTPSQYQVESMPAWIYEDGRISTYVGGNIVQRPDGDLVGILAPTDSPGPRDPVTRLYNRVWNDTSEVGAGVLYRADFDGANAAVIPATQGALVHPTGVLAIGPDGAVYGADMGPAGNGRIFRLDAEDNFSVVHEFETPPTGMKALPNGLAFDADGVLYGVVAYDRGVPGFPGTLTDPDTPTGIVYRIDPASAGSFQVLYAPTLRHGEFSAEHPMTSSSVNGTRQYALAYVVAPGDGWLYGTTSIGNCQLATKAYHEQGSSWVGSGEPTGSNTLCANNSFSDPDNILYSDPDWYDVDYNRYGTVYRVRTDGTGEAQILHRFSDTDGATPRGPLAVGPDGAVYGTTMSGGSNQSWDEIALKDNPAYPVGNLNGRKNRHVVTDGVLWRIRPAGVQVDPSGAVTASGFELVHEFAKAQTGKRPTGVVAGADGKLYGSTVVGGRSWIASSGTEYLYDNKGTVWSYGPPPAASVTVTVSPAEIAAGGTAELTWTSDRARDCVASSSHRDWTGAQPAQGSITFTGKAAGLYNYSLSCVDEETGLTVSSELAILRVDTAPSSNDGNVEQYGNGGSSAPLILAALSGLALLRRRPQAGAVSHLLKRNRL